MFKIVITLFFTLFIWQNVEASAIDTLLIFYKKSGQVVPTKDSADYFRFILPPDTSVDKDEYRVDDFYMNGKKKMIGTSLTSGLKPAFDGIVVSYFPNGRRSSLTSFQNGHLNGTTTNYYPNSKIYNVINFSLDSYGNTVAEVKEWRDSTGTMLVVNGKGHVIIFNEDFTKVNQEGNIEKNKFEGEWQGLIADTGRYVCFFHKGVLKSGTSYLKSGKQYNFKNFFVDAVFNDGFSETFYQYIQKNLRYPDAAKKRKIKGVVRVGFTIDATGMITNVKILSGLMPSLDEEALRVIRSAPMWDPATQYGIPVSVTMSTGVYF